MIAETILGDGDRAFEYYNQINPAKKNEIIDEYECEPYVYPQNILGDEHRSSGWDVTAGSPVLHHGFIRRQPNTL